MIPLLVSCRFAVDVFFVFWELCRINTVYIFVVTILDLAVAVVDILVSVFLILSSSVFMHGLL